MCIHKNNLLLINLVKFTAADCANLKTLVPQTVSGVHFIQYYTDEVSVYCDMETNGGGWTVGSFTYINFEDRR